jgi:hypothetical protein
VIFQLFELNLRDRTAPSGYIARRIQIGRHDTFKISTPLRGGQEHYQYKKKTMVSVAKLMHKEVKKLE